MNDAQRSWQYAALTTLLDEAIQVDGGPWIPADVAVDEIRAGANCTTQAATGALRALLTVGLAASIVTARGRFWKATDAATRMHDLVVAPPPAPKEPA